MPQHLHGNHGGHQGRRRTSAMARLTQRGRHFGFKPKSPSQSSWSLSLHSAYYSLPTEHRNSNRRPITPLLPDLSGANWWDAMTICLPARHQHSLALGRIYAIPRMTRVASKDLETWSYHCRDQEFLSRMISHRTRLVTLSFGNQSTLTFLQTNQHGARKPSAESFV